MNEVREHFHTVDYDSLATGTRGEVCSTNGTELKKDIETGPDTPACHDVSAEDEVFPTTFYSSARSHAR